MNERWKYQIKTGVPFGIIMPIIMTLFDWYGTSATFLEAFISVKFLTKFVIFMTVGIFLIGYSNWREHNKNQEYNKQK
ncbi:hypothetical protein [Flavobacterium wongokense]|uniref:hypothetical protein n=1 Tax=Flavobacterium wongokense TaxID=2910674 RepID=UPI001F2997BC|nr:hypothetical protein [Flavobacterium sp. WG47]MCF6131387.1 hypothetical protein [Flavobacterium sp. WG47]